MNGLINAISTHASNCITSYNSGTVWDDSLLDGLMKANYDNSNGEMATDLFMGSYLRKETDAWTQKSNVVVNTGGMTTIVRTVSTYETAFGTLRIHTHRYIQQSGDATGRVLAIRPQKFAIAFLERPFVDTGLARSGDYDKRMSSLLATISAKSHKFRENLRETMATLSEIIFDNALLQCYN